MKKLFIVAAMALVSMGASAQHAVGGVTLQPQVGMTLANLTDTDDSKMKAGLVAGAEVEYQATDMIGIAGGVLYSMQGADKKHGDALNLDYLNIPLRAKVYLAPGFSVNAGVQFGFLMRAKADDVDMKDACEKFDFTIPVGASYEISNIVFDARYNLGLTKVVKAGEIPGIGEIEPTDAKNSIFMLTVGYRFDF